MKTAKQDKSTPTLTEQLEAMDYAITSSEPSAVVRDDWGAGKTPVLKFAVVITRKGAPVHSCDYFVGSGHVRPEHFKAVAKRFAASSDIASAARTLAAKPHAQLRDVDLHARTLEAAARHARIAPTLPDVLHSLLMDGGAYFDPQTFEDWAGEYGYDPDSRKAEAIWKACDETGRALARAIPAAELAQLRDLFSDY